MEAEKIWSEIKNHLARDETISPEIYNYYISTSNLITSSDNECLIVTSSQIAKGIFQTGLINKIKDIIKNNTGIDYNIKIKLASEINSQPKIINNIETNNNKDAHISNYTFETYVRGDSNHEAFQASLAITLDLGKKWNPLFIYGDSGLGKTHLLFAIKNKILELHGDKKKVKYLKADEFGKIAMDILNQGHEAIENFKISFNSYDCLLIDDIQMLAKRNKTNELFFYIFNNFVEKDKQIVITSDKFPEELGGFESRLISRFSYGLSIGLDSPDFETALKILEQKLTQQNNLSLFSHEALEFIALNFNSDVRKLEGAIKRLVFISVVNKKPNEIITLKDVEKTFNNVPLKNNEKTTSKKIKHIVAENYNITIKTMTGKSRISNIMQARQVAMYLCRILLDDSFTKIGLEFGGKDHTTVMNSVKKIEQLISKNKEFKNFVKAIIKQIES